MDRRRRWVWVLAFVVVVGAAVVALAWGRDDGTRTASPSTTTAPATTTSTTTTTTAPAPTSTTSPSTTTTAVTQEDAVPGVATVSAGAGGGSGEVDVHWNAVAGATGYRVLRAGSEDGGYEIAADLDVTTGATTAASGVTNIWSEQHTYLPSSGALGAPDRSSRFDYVDVGAPQMRCFRVTAYNAAGEGLPSAPSCGSPP